MAANDLIYRKNYNNLRKIIDFNELKHNCYLKIKYDKLDLNVILLFYIKKGFVISLISINTQENNLTYNFKIKVRISTKFCVAEALSYQNNILGINSVVYKENMINLKTKKEINQILNRCLIRLKNQELIK